MQNLGTRFWIESTLALASATLLMLTLISRTWIETVFKTDPDAGSGAVEWIIVGVTLAITVGSVTLARREWKQRRLLAHPR